MPRQVNFLVTEMPAKIFEVLNIIFNGRHVLTGQLCGFSSAALIVKNYGAIFRQIGKRRIAQKI